MPIYEYLCEKCGETSEVLQKFSDEPLSDCPSCGGPVNKLMSANNFQLKGGGWYVTDYAPKKAGSASDSCAETKTCGATATEKKPEASPCKSCDKAGAGA